MGGLSTQTYLLSMEEKKQVCAELMNAAAGRVPVMMNVMEDSIRDAKELVEAYMEIGVDAVCISQPSVFPYTEQALYEFFDEVIPAEYPTYIYNVPQTGNTLSPRLTARIANDHANVPVSYTHLDVYKRQCWLWPTSTRTSRLSTAPVMRPRTTCPFTLPSWSRGVT